VVVCWFHLKKTSQKFFTINFNYKFSQKKPLNPVRYFLSFLALDNKYHFQHCQRTSAITFTLLGIIGVLIFLSVSYGFNPEIYGQNVILVLGVGATTGIGGMIYYGMKKRS
jgi:hypothetical protein